MKRLILLIAFFAIASSTVANAQFVKKRLLIDSFETADRANNKYVDAVRNKAIAGVQSTNRMVVIDVASESSLAVESERRSDVSTLDDETARLGEIKQLGADYLMTGTIDSFTTERKKTDEGKTYYKSELTVTIKLINVTDGSLFTTRTLKSSGGGSLFDYGSTEDKAVSDAISGIGSKTYSVINASFPLKGTIVELKESKKKKLVSCYIDLGTVHGVSKGQNIQVSKITEIAGRQSVIEIGRMRIEASVAEDLSECKVMKGGEEILAAFNEGSELVIKTM